MKFRVIDGSGGKTRKTRQASFYHRLDVVGAGFEKEAKRILNRVEVEIRLRNYGKVLELCAKAISVCNNGEMDAKVRKDAREESIALFYRGEALFFRAEAGIALKTGNGAEDYSGAASSLIPAAGKFIEIKDYMEASNAVATAIVACARLCDCLENEKKAARGDAGLAERYEKLLSAYGKRSEVFGTLLRLLDATEGMADREQKRRYADARLRAYNELATSTAEIIDSKIRLGRLYKKLGMEYEAVLAGRGMKKLREENETVQRARGELLARISEERARDVVPIKPR